MKLKIGEAHNLFSALQRMDNDVSLKLKDTVQLAIVINLNRLQEHAQAYEKIRQREFLKLRNNGYRDEITFNAQFSLRDIELRDETIDVELAQITWDDLKPTKGEHHITNRIWLRPMLSDFPA